MDKLREAEAILGMKLNHVDLDLDEIQHADAKKIAEHKVLQAWEHVTQPVMVWDQSIYISCLNGFPGPLIKWFWEQVGLEKICSIVHLFDDHAITTETILTYFDGETVHYFVSAINGTVPSEPRGTLGWGWDPIFIPNGHERTYGEMNSDEVLELRSHRAALKQLRDYLAGK